jgi:hypothetical protein
LKRHAARDPDNLPVHLELAIAYAQLGRNIDAQTEAGEILRLNPQFSIAQWKNDPGPYKDEAIWHRVVGALQRAGLK